jgi:hypothetical protein
MLSFWFKNCFGIQVAVCGCFPIQTGRYWLVKIGNFDFAKCAETVFRNTFTASFCE